MECYETNADVSLQHDETLIILIRIERMAFIWSFTQKIINNTSLQHMG